MTFHLSLAEGSQVKYILSRRGLVQNELRLPLLPASGVLAELLEGFA
jgi:hypothetical protein